jgi:nucleoside-diphosphate-sugar epimerase
MNDKKVLLIGGTGVLSSSITAELLRQNFRVSMLNRGSKMNTIPLGVELLQADFHDEKKVRNILQGKYFDAVIDFICYTLDNLNYSFNLLKDFVTQYVFISSCAVYDTRITGIHSEDDKKILDIWPYSLDKEECEKQLIKLASSYNIKSTIIRPGITYGDTRIPYGVMPPYGYHGTVIQRILNGKPLIMWDGGTARSNIMRVEDFAVGAVGLLCNPEAYDKAFNICGDSDKAAAWNQVLDSLSCAVGEKIKTVDIPSSFYANEVPSLRGEILGGRAITNICSNSLLKKTVPGFSDRISLYDGIKSTVECYKSHGWELGMYYQFDGETDRTIYKFLKANGRKDEHKQYRLYFIDYLHTNSVKNRLLYWYGWHRNDFLVQILVRIRLLIIKIKHIK